MKNVMIFSSVVLVIAILAVVAIIQTGLRTAPDHQTALQHNTAATTSAPQQNTHTNSATYQNTPPAVTETASRATETGRVLAPLQSATSQRGGENSTRAGNRTDWGSYALFAQAIAYDGLERVYIGVRAVEMDYFKKPKRNDTVVKIYGVLDDEARREFLSYVNSSAGVVERARRDPEFLAPGDVAELVDVLRAKIPIRGVYYAWRIEYATLVAGRNETTAWGPVADLLVLDDADFVKLGREHLGIEVDPCSNTILLPSDYGSFFKNGQVVEAFVPLGWYGVSKNTARAFLHANMQLRVEVLKIGMSGDAVGFIGRCFAESFTDLPPDRSYVVIEAPEKTAIYINRKLYELRYTKALERLAADKNATRYIKYYEDSLEEIRKEIKTMEVELGIS